MQNRSVGGGIKTDEMSELEKEEPNPGDIEPEEPSEDQHKRVHIDYSKIGALKAAGWKTKDIADEMRLTPKQVYNALHRLKQLEGKHGSAED